MVMRGSIANAQAIQTCYCPATVFGEEEHALYGDVHSNMFDRSVFTWWYCPFRMSWHLAMMAIYRTADGTLLPYISQLLLVEIV